MKVSVNIPDSLVESVDAFAKSNDISRSAAVTMALRSYLDSRSTIDTMRSLSGMMQQLVKDGAPATQEEISQLDAISKVIGMMK